jgi:hypothetical protein
MGVADCMASLARVVAALLGYTVGGIALLIWLAPSARESELYSASATGDAAAIATLLERGASPHVGQVSDWEPLLRLLQPAQPPPPAGNEEYAMVVDRLLLDSCSLLQQAWPPEFFRRPFSATTPLWIAAELGHTESVHALLAGGASPNAGFTAGPCGSIGWSTPLHVAVVGGHSGIVSALLQAGADPYAGESAGPWGLARVDTPLSTALLADVPLSTALDVMETLLEQGKADPSRHGSIFVGLPGPSPLEEAEDEQRGHPVEFRRLLRRYATAAADGSEGVAAAAGRG